MDKNYNILQKELEHAAAAATPLHMPGHKRRVAPCPGLPYGWDTTELDATDDLHAARGILAEAMARTAALWGARRTWYLVGGSTVGVLAGLRALTLGRGRDVLVARNCHKSVFHALELNALTPHWLTPPVDEAFGVYGSLSPAAVRAALDSCPAAACVVVTSPTYEGVLSDIAGIAAVCHARGVPLLVDEAHGAHYLPLAAAHGWRGGAVAAGADLVVQSAHKTLPSLTQTALLHLSGPLADADEVERQLEVMETSSPSYPLLASLDGCTGWLAAEGDAAFAAWRARLERFDRAAAGFGRLRIACHGADALADHPAFYGYDDGKLLLAAGTAGAAFLRAHGFEPEMVCGPNVLAMTSPCDAPDTLDRLAQALAAYDRDLPPQASALPVLALPAPGRACCTPAQAMSAPWRALPAGQAQGRVSACYVWAYPPGVPLLVPGEEIGPAFLQACAALQGQGTALRCSPACPPGCLRVLA